MESYGSSYWCYRCNNFVRVQTQGTILCPDCGSGFLEEIDPRRQSHHDSVPRVRRHWRNGGGEQSSFNPVIVLRGGEAGGERGSYELYYDDGTGLGIRPLPASMSEFLMGSGFDRLLDQLTHLEINGIGRFDHSPASKASIESLPTIKIGSGHVVIDSHCAVCKERFEIDTEAREMPCNHIYHSDCILPWLSIRNSCPVCRHELAADAPVTENLMGSNEEDSVGLTIWRLPGGGFAVGRFTGGRLAAERELPVVYTEMDGGFNAGGAPRRIAWAANENSERERSGMSQAVRGFFSFFRRFRFASSRFRLEIGFRRSRSHSIVDYRPPRRHTHR